MTQAVPAWGDGNEPKRFSHLLLTEFMSSFCLSETSLLLKIAETNRPNIISMWFLNFYFPYILVYTLKRTQLTVFHILGEYIFMSHYQRHWIYRIHTYLSVNSLFKEHFLAYITFVKKKKEKEKEKRRNWRRKKRKKGKFLWHCALIPKEDTTLNLEFPCNLGNFNRFLMHLPYLFIVFISLQCSLLLLRLDSKAHQLL